jgi:benzoyl-CoA reductase/2-hydroxyglutaryl-CoA dehydratase subunit BcrC/BadD/HgdB
MSVFSDDIVRFTSVLKIAYDFLAGREYLKRKKFRENKKLISVALPFSDLAFACGAVPVFPIRMEILEINKYLGYLGSASNIFGWKNVSNFLGFIKNSGIEDLSKIVDSIIDNAIDTINKKYNEMYDLGIENGISSDFCYGIKSLYGMHVSKGKNCDAVLNFTIRCSAYNKYLESLKTIQYPPKQIWVDIPPRNIGNALEILSDNISKAIAELEILTGIKCNENNLRKHFELGNHVKSCYKTILHEISTTNFYPCNPATFSEILVLLNHTFQDFNSNASGYAENMTQLVSEMKQRIKKGIGMDVSNMPKVLITPMFGGWEPKTHEILYELGGRAIYADWDMLYLLENIDISKSADPIEEYAKYLLKASSNGIGCDNETLTNSYIRIAKELNIDGLVFIQLFGCHSISNCYTMLREKVRRELEVPTTILTFNKIGENMEQVKTRLGAFMEMF